MAVYVKYGHILDKGKRQRIAVGRSVCGGTECLNILRRELRRQAKASPSAKIGLAYTSKPV